MNIKDCVSKSIKEAFLANDITFPIYEEIPVQGTKQPYCVVSIIEEEEKLRASNPRYQTFWRTTALEVRYAENIDGPGYRKAYELVAPTFNQALRCIQVPLGETPEGEEQNYQPLKCRGSLMKTLTDNILVYVVVYTEIVYIYNDQVAGTTEELTTTIKNKEI